MPVVDAIRNPGLEMMKEVDEQVKSFK